MSDKELLDMYHKCELRSFSLGFYTPLAPFLHEFIICHKDNHDHLISPRPSKEDWTKEKIRIMKKLLSLSSKIIKDDHVEIVNKLYFCLNDNRGVYSVDPERFLNEINVLFYPADYLKDTTEPDYCYVLENMMSIYRIYAKFEIYPRFDQIINDYYDIIFPLYSPNDYHYNVHLSVCIHIIIARLYASECEMDELKDILVYIRNNYEEIRAFLEINFDTKYDYDYDHHAYVAEVIANDAIDYHSIYRSCLKGEYQDCTIEPLLNTLYDFVFNFNRYEVYKHDKEDVINKKEKDHMKKLITFFRRLKKDCLAYDCIKTYEVLKDKIAAGGLYNIFYLIFYPKDYFSEYKDSYYVYFHTLISNLSGVYNSYLEGIPSCSRLHDIVKKYDWYMEEYFAQKIYLFKNCIIRALSIVYRDDLDLSVVNTIFRNALSPKFNDYMAVNGILYELALCSDYDELVSQMLLESDDNYSKQ